MIRYHAFSLFRRFIRYAIAILFTLGVGIAGSYFSTTSDLSWYNSLSKPALTPPTWAFAPVWTILYILLGISLARIWVATYGEERQRWLIVFFVQMFLNVLWSLLFFGLHALLLSWICIFVIWFMAVMAVAGASEQDRLSAACIVPYIIWISLAGILNFMLWSMN